MTIDFEQNEKEMRELEKRLIQFEVNRDGIVRIDNECYWSVIEYALVLESLDGKQASVVDCVFQARDRLN